ncbi:type IV secretion system protein [Sphingomonas lenta]|uniref:Type VI secretion protein n=1 Tax=Sphingomonas lenta TaxID=1141887 RepID=A0A2A2SAW7_9SPHN|nr:type IV secretion system protein [Sphingomonas lenta]PAX06397.1 hypothetical protein CKY28_17510 [Sphingomonas lenta]
MAVACGAPDASLGVAVRLAAYLDCQARALGENGFQALIGGPVMTGLLSGLLTIFVALIGYRLVLGQTPTLRDGVGWAVRLGVVLALVTSWPAFQALVYRVAVDGPGELASVLLPVSGLPAEDLDARVQTAYDTMRLGSAGLDAPVEAQQPPPGSDPSGQAQPGQAPQTSPQARGAGYAPLPQTASLFVVSTTGVAAAFRVAVGFLLAIGPLAILGLLFDATFGLFSGWVRTLGGSALGLLAASVVTALDLLAVESELANLQAYSVGGIALAVDPQALTTIVLLFAVVMLVAAAAAVKVAGAFRLVSPVVTRPAEPYREAAPLPQAVPAIQAAQAAGGEGSRAGLLAQPRAAAVADALAMTVRREQLASGGGEAAPQAPSRRVSIVEAASRTEPGGVAAPLGVAGRRSVGRRTLSAQARDRIR